MNARDTAVYVADVGGHSKVELVGCKISGKLNGVFVRNADAEVSVLRCHIFYCQHGLGLTDSVSGRISQLEIYGCDIGMQTGWDR